jgi:hypothetical protein
MKVAHRIVWIPVYSKTSTTVTTPASRVNVGPPVIDNFSNRPPAVVTIVTPSLLVDRGWRRLPDRPGEGERR